ncbi:hypothetical protein C7447_103367 [Tenacibaculum adriaticum]|uniref:Uncharacterized protein n=1 Tax=Tenacibaculum adriaticum TaxID=413713 RepID=A0A5S5DQN6_9FLAO|nr:hypothetical protein C7447_103367 [Tenacibaculum adriaticum]
MKKIIPIIESYASRQEEIANKGVIKTENLEEQTH